VRAQRQDALFVASNVTPRILALENVAPSQLALDDLLDYTRFLRSQGEDVAAFELATWRKLSQPLSVAALVLVAISFVFGPLREGTMGFRIFAGVMVGVLFRLGQDLLGPSSLVFGFPPLYAALLPVLVCIGVGTLLLRRA
jgi:lipopolysaccharide export system permease protein